MTGAHTPEPFITIHIAEVANGHLNSLDCWCEPAADVWNRDTKGTLVRLVAHEDYTLLHRNTVISARDKKPGWITRRLSQVGVKKGTSDENDQ